jgi:acyl-lipid omega-6 desaturase (Delta-12 desaturase)
MVNEKAAWVADLKQFEKPEGWKVAVQLLDTVLPFLGLMTLMYLTIGWGLPVWVTLLLALPTGAFMLRTFIFFHDCCHGSLVGSPVALEIIGNVLGFLCLTPFAEWRWSHGMHHATAGDLDRRGVGDVWTMTVKEYEAAGLFGRALYRFYRFPPVTFFLGPILSFVIMNRIPGKGSRGRRLWSVILTNVALAGVITALALTVGIKAFLLVELSVLVFGGAAGVWLFYVQHNFDPSYWAHTSEWQSMDAAMLGSSYYKLPAVLRWISGSIGLHHLHHLRPRIPNYNLQRAVASTPELQLPNALTLRTSLRSMRYKVWDEDSRAFLTFRQMTQALRSRPRAAQV